MGQTMDKVDDLVITRVFDAPREKVWKMWSDCAEVMLWWGPKGFTSPSCRMDFREGGKIVYCMRSPADQGGGDFYSTGTYRKIKPLEEIVVTDSFSDEHGNVVPASFYGMDADFPLELLITLHFEDLGGKTRMTLTHSGMSASEMREMTAVGWNESFDKIDAVLAEG